MATVIPPREKHRVVKHSKSTTAQDRGGHSGNGNKPARYRKKHLRAHGAPGTPQGICDKQRMEALKTGEKCRCGHHNKAGA